MKASVLCSGTRSRVLSTLLQTTTPPRPAILQAGPAQVFVESPWGVGVLNLNGSTFQVPVMKANGTQLGNWLLNTLDNRFG